MRRTKIKKKSKSELTKAKDKLWKVLKSIIDIRDGDNCISCEATGLKGYNKHGGHFIPSSSCGGFLRYDLRNVHNQCATCNLYRNGAGAEYTLNLQKKYGKAFVERIVQDKQVTIKLTVKYIDDMREYYTNLLGKTKDELIKLTKNYAGFKQTE